MKATITTIQRMSLHDGPGIRSTLFLKGCNYRCPWCHNPETLTPEIQLQHISSKCISCSTCVAVCNKGALYFKDGVLNIERSLCDVCGKCSESCLSGALNLVGREVSVDEAFEELLQDRVFYETSGGGITISGGEPFLQPEFVAELLRRCREEGLHTAVQTNLSLSWENISLALPFVDLWMCDLKGSDYADVICNLKRLADSGAEMVVRTPVIPGVNDSRHEIARLCETVRSLGPGVRYELMPFHTLGFGKYSDLGMSNPMIGAKDYEAADFALLCNVLKEYGY
jgi:pyruvate formate lyase activating enzyme